MLSVECFGFRVEGLGLNLPWMPLQHPAAHPTPDTPTLRRPALLSHPSDQFRNVFVRLPGEGNSQGRSTQIISMIKWIRTGRLSMNNSLQQGYESSPAFPSIRPPASTMSVSSNQVVLTERRCIPRPPQAMSLTRPKRRGFRAKSKHLEGSQEFQLKAKATIWS